MKSIRGAIAVVENNYEDIIESSKLLIKSILEQNYITESDIVNVIFTVTGDLTKAFPAKAFRELGMNSVSALDTSAPNIENDLPGCIRIMMNVSKDLNVVNHVYLKEAASLRKDR